MLNRYYSILILLIIIIVPGFSESILLKQDTTTSVYVEFHEYNPNLYEIFNLYASRIELNGNTIYEKLLGSVYYTGVQSNEGADLKILFKNNTFFPDFYYIVPTGQILTNTNFVLENFKDTREKNDTRAKNDKEKDSEWNFDAAVSGGIFYSLFGEYKYNMYRINLGLVYRDLLRFRASPIILENQNILINISIDILLSDFGKVPFFLSAGFYPYQKLSDETVYLFSMALGLHIDLFKSNFFFEISSETDIIRPLSTISDSDIDVAVGILGSIGYSF